MYTYLSTCTHICRYTYICIYIYAHIHIYTYIHTYIYGINLQGAARMCPIFAMIICRQWLYICVHMMNIYIFIWYKYTGSSVPGSNLDNEYICICNDYTCIYTWCIYNMHTYNGGSVPAWQWSYTQAMITHISYIYIYNI